MNYSNLIFMWTIVFTISVHEYNAEIPCDPPVLKNGKVRTRQRGKLARFQCVWSYELMGDRYSVCVEGKWNPPIPICIRPGCKNPLSPKNGIGMFSRRNAAVMFFCNPGYTLKGSSKMYCDGRVWNDTTPTCVGNVNSLPILSCDFEEADLCGWSPDPMHDFDWRRQLGSTPSGHIGTGPSYDHTKGYGKDGFYMYIESSSKVENDTARLVSPIFPSNLSQSGCFVFYYHMYGRTTGTLRVLVYPESLNLSTIVNSTRLRQRYTMFEKSGNQGNIWFKGFFELDEMEENFQIVIEGVRGSGYVSDIAIDDVVILQNEKCAREKENNKTLIIADSCVNRCGIHVISEDVNIETECECTDECEIQNTCCIDYRDLCIFADTPIAEASPLTYTTDTTSDQSSSIKNENSLPSEANENIDLQYSTTIGDQKQFADTITTRMSTTETTAIFTTVKTTTKTTSFSIINTTIPTTVSKAVITNSTTVNTIPRLQFVDKDPPIKNVTGIKKIWPQKPYMNLNNQTTKFYKKPINVTNVQTTLNMSTLYQKSTTKATPISRNFSKAYIHYGKNEDGKNIVVTTEKSIFKITPNKLENIITFNQDALQNNIVPEEHASISIISIILLATGILIFSFLLITGAKSGMFIREIERIRTKFTRSRRTNREGTDIRFLVEDEELEHNY